MQPSECAHRICAWIQQSFDSGTVALGLAKNAVLGFQDRFWWMSLYLKPCWKDLKSWEDGEPFELRRPWPLILLRGLLVLCFLWEWWATGLQLWVCFHCLLRPGEGSLLLWGHINLPEDIDGVYSSMAGVLKIDRPKSRRAAARKQMVLIDDVWLLWLLRALRDIFGPRADDALYGYTQGTLNKCIRSLLQAVGLPNSQLTAGGLRAGGATHFLRCGYSVEWLRHRGRWQAPRSMDHCCTSSESPSSSSPAGASGSAW